MRFWFTVLLGWLVPVRYTGARYLVSQLTLHRIDATCIPARELDDVILHRIHMAKLLAPFRRQNWRIDFVEGLELLADTVGLLQYGNVLDMSDFFDPADPDLAPFIRYGLISKERVQLLVAAKERRSPRP
jgi:hypothetical protein